LTVKRFVVIRRQIAVAAAALGIVTGSLVSLSSASAADPCAAAANPVACENQKPGDQIDDWDITGVGNTSIQGYATDMSVNVGTSIGFKVKTSGISSYNIAIYRLGYYGGLGSRKVATISGVTAKAGNVDSNCVSDPNTELFDCGKWAVSATWAVPADAISGVYVALLLPSNGGPSEIPFVVRNDASTSKLLFKTSDATWQAYNSYSGADFYQGNTHNRARRISYNRPFWTRGTVQGRDYLFSNEYPMLKFLERNGYDLSYTTDVDTDRFGSLIKNHRVFMSTGHDEYWSKNERANVEAARDAGVNLTFFSGNEVYWKTRYEPSVDGTNTANRTLTCWKETWDNAKSDTSTSDWTGTYRDPRFSPPADGGKPENSLTGVMFMSNSDDLTMQVPAAQGKLRQWRNTSVANLAAGQTASLAPHTVGYESDEDVDNGFRPAGLMRLSTTTGATPEYLRDFGQLVTPGTTTHTMTLYRAASGALVFGAGTIQFAWGLDTYHDGTVSPADVRMQQFVVNILGDMGVQPANLMSGLVAATPSTDAVDRKSTRLNSSH